MHAQSETMLLFASVGQQRYGNVNDAEDIAEIHENGAIMAFAGAISGVSESVVLRI